LRVVKKLSVAGTTEPRYFRTSSWCCWIASEIGKKITPAFAQLLLERGRDRDRIEYRVDGDPRIRAIGTFNAGDHLLFAERDSELRIGLEDLWIDLVSDFGPGFVFGAA
jgi:hypothetical protein